MRRVIAVVHRLLLGCLLTILPLGLMIGQTPSLPHSSHATGRGMRLTPMTIGTPTLRAGGAGTSSLVPGGAGLSVDSLNATGIGNDPVVCAQGCSAGAYQQGTVPYYSLDVARNVTLIYTSELAVPRPILFADVHIDPSSVKTLVEYDLQATFNGAAITFLNGDTKLRFSAPSPQTTEVRLAAQFDSRSNPAQVDSLTLTITAVWSDATTQQAVYGGRFVNPNGIGSAAGRGWLIGGVQQLAVQASGDILMNNGDGSVGWFASNGGGTYLTEMDRDFSILTSAGSGSSKIYTRTYPDSSRVYFDYHGNELGTLSSQSDTTLLGYDSVGHITKIYDPYRTYSGGSSRSYITLHYNASGFLDQVQEPGGDGTPGAGRVTYVTIATGDSTLTAIKDPDGDSTRFVYNTNKVLTTLIDRRGDTTRYAYDTHSWLVDSIVAPRVPIDAGGGSTTLNTPITTVSPWQTLGIPTSSTTTTPATPVASSTIKGTLVDPLGRSTIYTVDLDGAPLSTTGPLSQTVTVTRDGLWTELPVKVTYPTGGVDTMQFAANTPNLTYGQPAGDSASNYLYGVNGQLDSLWSQGTLALHAFLHSGTGLADSVRVGGTDSLMTQYTYDAQRRVLTVRDVNGHTATYVRLRSDVWERRQRYRTRGDIRSTEV
jgi:YD repeat-containing protein